MIETQLNNIISILETKAIENSKISRTSGLFEKVNTFLMSNDFREDLREILAQNDYKTQRILAAFKPLLDDIMDEEVEAFDKYLHQYAVSLAFPNASEITHEEKGSGLCYFYTFFKCVWRTRKTI